ncbi:MAG: murein L,D-transpeptidase catalytic domain family protein [Bacteroidales bacterium]|nr:murein L,D-transpeptidase catalytic domain family protein [Bacteroidales bacterium]
MHLRKIFILFALLIPFTALRPERGYEGISNDFQQFEMERILSKCETETNMPARAVFESAISGYALLLSKQLIKKTGLITIIDFTLTSDKKRMWVIDLNEVKVLVHCLVAHGRNSGKLSAESFSNKPGSFASSPGFYATGDTYTGKHGMSLFLDGLEEGVNDKARDRSIVIHGADYVSDEFIKRYGQLGRSHGCPAIPETIKLEVIQTIKGGSCLYIHAPDKFYSSAGLVEKVINRNSKS